MTSRLHQLRTGLLRLHDDEHQARFGPGRGGELQAEIRVHDLRFYRTLALRGTMGAAEAYLNGWWSSPDLVGLFRLLTQNASVMLGLDGFLARCLGKLNSWANLWRRNTPRGSRRNIAAHYDLGEDFYALFLDETLTYSAGVFTDPECTLAEATWEKYDRICRKLQLAPDHHVLEIGSGWGGFALHAARHHGCRVTTTTISTRQFAYARERVRRAGLEGRVTVLGEDYRNLKGTFDHLVSVEMVEAVGHEYLDTFFRKCSRLLRPEGMLLVQAITLPDHRFASYIRSVDFVQKYVFPGGCLPSVSALSQAVGRATDLRFLHLEDFGSHYAETLARWRQRFWRNIDQVRSLGFDERFIRLWHYYLCYCEAGFRENQIGVAQLVLAKPNCHRSLLLWQDEDHGPLQRGAH